MLVLGLKTILLASDLALGISVLIFGLVLMDLSLDATALALITQGQNYGKWFITCKR